MRLPSRLRSSAARYAWPLLAGATVLAWAGARPPGVWEWSSATQAITASLAITAPITAGLGALDAALWYSAGERSRLTQAVRAPLGPVVLHAIAGLAWCLGGCVAGSTVVAALMVVHDAYGSPIVLWLVASAGALGLSWCLGYLAGLLARGRWTVAPLAAIATYVGFIPASQLPRGDARWLSHLYVLTGDQTTVFSGYRATTLGGEALWYLGVACVSLAIAALSISRRGRSAALLVAAGTAVAVVGAGLVAAGRGVITEGEAAVDWACAGRGVEVCVAEPFADGLPALESAFTTLRARTAGTYLETPAVRQGYGGDASAASGAVPEIYVRDLAPGFERRAVAMYLASRVTPGGCRTGAGDGPFLAGMIAQWLAGDEVRGRAQASAGVVRASTRFAEWSEDERIEWFGRHAGQVRTCSLGSGDF